MKMALNIRNAETSLSAELAKETGETKTEAVTKALRDRLARVRRRPRRHLADELEQIAEHCANLPVLDSRPADEILGYDEQVSLTDGHRYVRIGGHPAEGA